MRGKHLLVHTRRWPIVLRMSSPFLSLLLGSAAVASPRIVWESEIPERIQIGYISMYESRDVRIEIPKDFYRDPKGEQKTQTFRTAFRLEIRVRNIGMDGEGIAEYKNDSWRGAISVATTLSPEDAEAGAAAIVKDFQVRSASTLHVPVPGRYGSERALFSYPDSPFFTEEPTWVCFEPAAEPPPEWSIPVTQVLALQHVKGPRGEDAISTMAPVFDRSEFASICDKLKAALPSQRTSVFHTRPAIKTRGRRSLTLALYRLGPARDAPVALPDGVAFERTTEKDEEGQPRSILRTRTFSTDLPLSLVRSTSVAMSWELKETTEGKEAPLGTWLVAVYPPWTEDTEGRVVPDPSDWAQGVLHNASKDYLEAVRLEFRDASFLTPPEVEKFLIEKMPILLRVGGQGSDAMAVICSGDESASYYLYPGSARDRVSNATSYCPMLRRELGKLEDVE